MNSVAVLEKGKTAYRGSDLIFNNKMIADWVFELW
jgi:hypothetical protein